MTLIHVTLEHIQKGVRHDGCRCPVARAMTDALGTVVLVSGYFAMIGTAAIVLPPAARAFAYSFDKGYEVRAFSFEFTS